MKIKKKYIFGGLFILCSVVCFITGCFSGSKNNATKNITKATSKLIKKEDYSRFVEIWNAKVYDLKMDINRKYDSSTWDKYILKNNYQDISNKLNSFLSFEDKYLTQLEQVKQKKFAKRFYLPVILWIEDRNKIKFENVQENITQSDLYNYLAKIVDNEYFSSNTVDKIIQLNDFCYNFEKNKIEFQKQGFTESITECQQIQKNLDKNNIKLKVYQK